MLRKIVRSILLAPIVLLLLFEEWGWEPLAAGFAALGRLPVWRQLERFIVRLPPWAALLAFSVPVLLLIPIKLLALYLFGNGHMASGLGLLLAAKVAGTALAARLFQLTQPALMQIGWFARAYTAWKKWKDRMLAQVRASSLWRVAGRLKQRVKLMSLHVRAVFRSAISRSRK